MTEPLRKYHSSDVPEYSSYPAEPDRPVVVVEEFAMVSEFDAMPEAANPYEERARKIGSALGRLVNGINEMVMPIRAQMHDKIERVEQQLGDDVEIARQTAEQTFDDARRKVASVTRRGIHEARARALQVRRKTVQTVNDYPVQTLAAAGVAGIIAGVGLRVWRENRG
jgi:ElaB/YqjD/DUF883 family membrane-anchored ribosome-binding protein